MKQKFLINLKLGVHQFNILIKSIEYFKHASAYLDNEEYQIETEELRTAILDSLSTIQVHND